MNITEQEKLLIKLWNTFNIGSIYSSLGRTKLEKYLKNAFDIENTDIKDKYNSLLMWYLYFSLYPYKSIKDFDSHLQLHALITKEEAEIANEWLTPDDVVNIYGFSKSTQAKYRMASSSSGLPFYKIGSKFIRYKRSEIDEWIKNGKMR